MKRILLATALAITTFTAPASATDLMDMTDSERDVFRAEVRAYLMENPEVLLEAINVLEQRQATEEAVNDATLLLNNADEIFNDGVSYVGGNPDGDVTVVEFSDYRCPYCKRAHKEVAQLLAQDGNIRFIYKEFPILGPDSLTAAQFAVAVLLKDGPEKYRAVNDALMEMRGDPSEAALTAIANEQGLDAGALLEGMKSSEVTQIIQANRALGQRLKISGTPTFIIGDQILRGYLPLDNMQAIVKEARTLE
ncbi:DsbA family protein [Profundibacter amoris]|uniref:DsbA family protein n=1 Tax=Profundibacter amoris TaxID=2171755 RepID=A0A347UHE2_9RHOB|nr:DsbA family protein [Profundibacter amoris]AXX98270.1 DsbA family protein [Profundibacter amoris]